MADVFGVGSRYYTPNTAPQQCVDPSAVENNPFYTPQQNFTPAAPPIIAPTGLSVISGTPTTAPRFEDMVYSDLAAGRSSRWVTVNLSGLKYVNDHYVGGHDAGDAYLEAAKAKLSAISLELFGTDVMIRNGPNLVIRAPENFDLNLFTSRVRTAFSNGVDFSYKYKKQTINTSYTAATEGRAEIYNIGELKFDRSLCFAAGTVLITKGGIYRALREQIYFLNRRELRSNRHDSTYVIRADQAALLNSYSLENRLLDFNPRVEAPAGAAIEPSSRLANGAQMQADAIRLLNSGKAVHFAFLDVNAMSSYRSLGFQGELMMDAIVEERMAQAAKVLPEGVGVIFYRAKDGSEEFYLNGDGTKVTAEQMRQASQDYMRALNETPFRLKVDYKAFKNTTLGARYLQEHPELRSEKLEIGKNKKGKPITIDVIQVDITDIVRQGASGLQSRGITITLGQGTITPEMVAERGAAARGPESAAAVTFEQVSKAITELGEVAKNLNPQRRNLQIEVDFVNGKAVGRIIPLDNALSDPKPIPGAEHNSLIDEAVQNKYTIEFTVEDGKAKTITVKDQAGNIVADATQRAQQFLESLARAAEAFVNGAKNYVKEKTGIDLQGANPTEAKAEIRWILENSPQAIAERYGVSPEKARLLKNTVLAAATVPFAENCEITVDPVSGNIKVKTGSKTREFSDAAQAEEYFLSQVRNQTIKVRVYNLLNIEPGSMADGFMGTGGMAVTGAAAEAVVNLLFEAYRTARYEGHSFEGMRVAEGALSGFTGWGMMGVKMQFAQALGVSQAAALGYAILLPMFSQVNNPTLSYQERFVSGVSGGVGFGSFVLGEKLTGSMLASRGITANWPKAIGGTLVAALATAGAQRLLMTDYVQQNLSWEAQKVAVDTLGFANDRLQSYVYGEIGSAIINAGARFVAGTEAGVPELGVIGVFSGAAGDGASSAVYWLGGISKYEVEAMKLTSNWVAYWDAQSPWYRIDRWGLNPLARTVNTVLLGRNTAESLDTFGFGGLGECTMNDGSLCYDFAIDQEVNRSWTMINQLMAGLLLEHAQVSVSGNDVQFGFDVNAINHDINSRGGVTDRLGFINYHRPGTFDSLNANPDGTYTVNEQSAQNMFAYFVQSDISLPMQKADGSVEYRSFSSIINEQKASILEKSRIYTAVQGILRIESAKAHGLYQLGGEQHQLDTAAGLVNAQGAIVPQDAKITAALDKVRTDLTVQFAASMISADAYTALAIVTGLADQGKLDLAAWVKGLPADKKIRVEFALKFSQRVSELRYEMEEMKIQLEALETAVEGERAQGITASPDQQAFGEIVFKLSRMTRELETYYMAAGYPNDTVQELGAFRQGLEMKLGVSSLPGAVDIYQEPLSQTESEARQILAQRADFPRVGEFILAANADNNPFGAPTPDNPLLLPDHLFPGLNM